MNGAGHRAGFKDLLSASNRGTGITVCAAALTPDPNKLRCHQANRGVRWTTSKVCGLFSPPNGGYWGLDGCVAIDIGRPAGTGPLWPRGPHSAARLRVAAAARATPSGRLGGPSRVEP
jgi:hypothetical protein